MGGDEKFIISSLSLRSCFTLFQGCGQDVQGQPKTGREDGGKN